MTRYHSSRPPHCVSPRPHTDAHQRYRDYGPVQPMQADNGWDRWKWPIRARLAGWVIAAGVAVCWVIQWSD